VILNLLSNAAKFTDEGSISVGARAEGNGEVVLWVKDSGIGIPPQDMDKIFEEFRQGTSGRRKGRAGRGWGWRFPGSCSISWGPHLGRKHAR